MASGSNLSAITNDIEVSFGSTTTLISSGQSNANLLRASSTSPATNKQLVSHPATPQGSSVPVSEVSSKVFIMASEAAAEVPSAGAVKTPASNLTSPTVNGASPVVKAEEVIKGPTDSATGPQITQGAGRVRRPIAPREDDDRKVFIGNLPANVTEDEVKSHFATAGDVESVRLIRNFYGYSKRFAFVVYKDGENRNQAAELLNDKLFHENKLVVQVVVPKEQLPRKPFARRVRRDVRRPRRHFDGERNESSAENSVSTENENQTDRVKQSSAKRSVSHGENKADAEPREANPRRLNKRAPRRPRNPATSLRGENEAKDREVKRENASSTSSTIPEWGSGSAHQGRAHSERSSSPLHSNRFDEGDKEAHSQHLDSRGGRSSNFRGPRSRFGRRYGSTRNQGGVDDAGNQNGDEQGYNSEGEAKGAQQQGRPSGRYAGRGFYRNYNSRGPRYNYGGDRTNQDASGAHGDDTERNTGANDAAGYNAGIGEHDGASYQGRRSGSGYHGRRPYGGYRRGFNEEGRPGSNWGRSYQPRPRREKMSGKQSETAVYVANLSFKVSDEELKEAFTTEKYAPIEAYVVRRGPQSKGFGFVEFETNEQQKNAISTLNGISIHGREISVHVALVPETNEAPETPETATAEDAKKTKESDAQRESVAPQSAVSASMN